MHNDDFFFQVHKAQISLAYKIQCYPVSLPGIEQNTQLKGISSSLCQFPQRDLPVALPSFRRTLRKVWNHGCSRQQEKRFRYHSWPAQNGSSVSHCCQVYLLKHHTTEAGKMILQLRAQTALAEGLSAVLSLPSSVVYSQQYLQPQRNDHSSSPQE